MIRGGGREALPKISSGSFPLRLDDGDHQEVSLEMLLGKIKVSSCIFWLNLAKNVLIWTDDA